MENGRYNKAIHHNKVGLIMDNFKQKFQNSPGQAIVEFALILTVLLMMIFLIIESARILWAWNTVQHAAREGARYAITGQTMGADCPIDFGPDKFLVPDGRDVCNIDGGNQRVASIIYKTHDQLLALPLNETSGIYEDDNYYNIEVWGVNEFGQLVPDNGGRPNQPVVVRVIYQVPIITPFFRPIRTTIPVFGQETLLNESFGQLGTTDQGAALPPVIPPLPTPGVTPSPTPSPTPTDTPTPGPPNTPTNTPTNTPPPICNVQFEGATVAGDNFVLITGDIGTVVTIIDLSTNPQVTLGSATLLDRGGHACPGFATIPVSPNLIRDHVLLATSNDTSVDTSVVVAQPPTNTPTPTLTLMPTTTATATATQTPTSTPNFPYIMLLPNCGTGPNVRTTIIGFNWPADQSLRLFWDNVQDTIIQASEHEGSFSMTRLFVNVADGTHQVRVQATGGASHTAVFTVPCSDVVIPTASPSPTATPRPADLIIGRPRVIATPVIGYEPVQFSVAITNQGDLPVESQFFVDVYIDPSQIFTDHIPLTDSSGYSAVSALGPGASRVLTITAPFGFQNVPVNHQVYGMVDSVRQIPELSEINNISAPPLTFSDVTPGATPTPTTSAGGNNTISGVAFIYARDLLAQYRAVVRVIDDNTGYPVASGPTDPNGLFQFNNIMLGTYTVTACITIDSEQWYGFRTGITPPNNLAHVIMLKRPCP